MAQTPETWKVGVGNSDRAQGFREYITIELGIVTRPWHGPHVKYPHNLIAPKQIDERLYRPV